MKKTKLTSSGISSLCLELSLLIHAGIGVNDSLHLLEENAERGPREILSGMARLSDEGSPLSEALRESGAFPSYVASLTAVGEKAGRLEETLTALSTYYEGRNRLEEQIRSALLYPVMLLVLMSVVIAVLLIKVLPVFNEVFASLGSRLTGLAGGLLLFGRMLDHIMPVLWILLALCVLFLMRISLSDTFRSAFLRTWQKRRGSKGLFGQISVSHFAQALALGMQSGLPVAEALDLASSFGSRNEVLTGRYCDCRSRLDKGAGLAEALRDSKIMPPIYCRMLELGIRSGTGDTVMQEISRRMENACTDTIHAWVSKVEPTLVIVTSVLVGAILLSVMLPLMNIMAAIG